MKSWSVSFVCRFLIDFWQLEREVARKKFKNLTFFIFLSKKFYAYICTLIFVIKNGHFFDHFWSIFWSFLGSRFSSFLFWKFIIFEELRRSYQIFRDFLANLHTRDENISNLGKNQQKPGGISMSTDGECRIQFPSKNKNSFRIIIQIYKILILNLKSEKNFYFC